MHEHCALKAQPLAIITSDNRVWQTVAATFVATFFKQEGSNAEVFFSTLLQPNITYENKNEIPVSYCRCKLITCKGDVIGHHNARDLHSWYLLFGIEIYHDCLIFMHLNGKYFWSALAVCFLASEKRILKDFQHVWSYWCCLYHIHHIPFHCITCIESICVITEAYVKRHVLLCIAFLLSKKYKINQGRWRRVWYLCFINNLFFCLCE